MRFSTILVAVLSTVTLVSSLSIFTIEEIDTTYEGVMIRPQVPAPQPPARFRQATRAGIIARQQRGPARRQISSSPICNRPITGSTPYAVFTDAFFYTNYAIGSHYRATQGECYAQCETNPACVAVTYITYVGSEDYACRPIYQLAGMSNYAGSGIVGEAKGMTCAQVKAMYPDAASFNCCDARRA